LACNYCWAADAGELAVTSARADIKQRARIAAVPARYRQAGYRPAVDRTSGRLSSDSDRQPRRSPPAAVVPRRLRSRRPTATPRCRAGLERQRETNVRQVRGDVIDATVSQLRSPLYLQLTAIIYLFIST